MNFASRSVSTAALLFLLSGSYSSNVWAASTGTGLTGYYCSMPNPPANIDQFSNFALLSKLTNQNPKVENINGVILASGAKPPSNLLGTNFAVHWRGSIEPTTTGVRPIQISSDDGAYLYIDGTLQISNGGLHAIKTVTKNISLNAGKHSIDILYFNGGGTGAFSIKWAPAGTTDLTKLFEVATNQLYPDDGKGGCGIITPVTPPVVDNLLGEGQITSAKVGVSAVYYNTQTFQNTDLRDDGIQLWGAAGPRMQDAIQQGQDCYVLSAMASIAANNTTRLRLANLIQSHGDGTYTVDFQGIGRKIRVDATFPAWKASFHGIWQGAQIDHDKGQVAYALIPFNVTTGKHYGNMWTAIVEKAWARIRCDVDPGIFNTYHDPDCGISKGYDTLPTGQPDNVWKALGFKTEVISSAAGGMDLIISHLDKGHMVSANTQVHTITVYGHYTKNGVRYLRLYNTQSGDGLVSGTGANNLGNLLDGFADVDETWVKQNFNSAWGHRVGY